MRYRVEVRLIKVAESGSGRELGVKLHETTDRDEGEWAFALVRDVGSLALAGRANEPYKRLPRP